MRVPLSPNFLDSAESGRLQHQEQLKQARAMVADDPILDLARTTDPTPNYPGINVFELLNEPDPLVKYNLEWHKPEVRDYIRRLYFLTQYGGTLAKESNNAWTCRVSARAPNPVSLTTSDMGYGNNTPEGAIDSALTIISNTVEDIYKERTRHDLRREESERINSPKRQFLNHLVVYSSGLGAGLISAWLLLHR